MEVVPCVPWCCVYSVPETKTVNKIDDDAHALMPVPFLTFVSFISAPGLSSDV